MKRPTGAGFRDVFAVAEFRGLWIGTLLSRGGDQLARVALAVLVFQRTGSAALTGLIFALTLVPAVIGGPLLTWIADRYPRRDVIVTFDLVRAGLIGVVAVPGLPLWLVFALVFASQLLESPQKAARIAILPQILPNDVYSTGVAVNHLTSQLLTLVGFGAGGLVVAAAGPEVAMLIDALTFAVSALVTFVAVRRRAAVTRDGPGTPVWTAAGASTRAGLRLIAGTPRLRGLLLLALLTFFHVVPEAIAVPYAASLGHGEAVAGYLMAVVAAGNVLGVFLLTRFVPENRRARLLAPMAVLSCVPLAAAVFHPGLATLLVLWTVGGLLTAYQVTANAEFVRLAPEAQRGQAVGLASSALAATSGLGVLTGGIVVQALDPPAGLALTGAIGVAASIGAALVWRRATQPAAAPVSG